MKRGTSSFATAASEAYNDISSDEKNALGEAAHDKKTISERGIVKKGKHIFSKIKDLVSMFFPINI